MKTQTNSVLSVAQVCSVEHDYQSSVLSWGPPGVWGVPISGFFFCFHLQLHAGVALVFLLLTLNLTVAAWTLNGPIFYANIVRANHAVSFLHGDRSFFSLFIAWLNLDLGAEMCFSSVMVSMAMPRHGSSLCSLFTSGWLLPLLCRHYTLAAKMCGPHAVKVLATLFLLWVLSYAKTVQTVITVLSFTSRRLLDGSTRTVWLYNGNVEYLGVKHTLFFTALLFAVGFLLPFTLLVLLAPCLQTWSNKRSLGGLTE